MSSCLKDTCLLYFGQFLENVKSGNRLKFITMTVVFYIHVLELSFDLRYLALLDCVSRDIAVVWASVVNAFSLKPSRELHQIL